MCGGRVSAAGLDEGRVGVAAQVPFVVRRTRSKARDAVKGVAAIRAARVRRGCCRRRRRRRCEARQLGRETAVVRWQGRGFRQSEAVARRTNAAGPSSLGPKSGSRFRYRGILWWWSSV